MKFINFKSLIFLLLVTSIVLTACNRAEKTPNMEEIEKMEKQFKDFSTKISKQVAEAYTKAALTYWEASISGKNEDFQKAQEAEIAFDKILSNKQTFEQLKKFKNSGLIQDSILTRNLELMYLTYLAKQVDPNKLAEMTKLQTKISQKFQTYRAKVDGKELTDNQVEEILKNSINSKELEKVWKAHKDIGPVVANDIIELVKKRNEVAKELGFKNYHEMSLKLSEQDPDEISKLFDELDELTRGAFSNLKKEVDEKLAKRLKIKIEDLKPWHYQNRYFQEAPKIYDIDLDTYFKGKDIVKLTQDYYSSIDLPIDDMIAKSDLFEKPGKNQHAYCIDIDRDIKDVRVLCNVKDNNNWMNTMLHEFGHAIYFKYHSPDLPWFLKTPAHTFTTEAIAMLFGRFASDAQWIQDMLKISDQEKEKISETTIKILKLEQLVFSRWSQVMYRFEKSLYENPDQDLNSLWWDLVEKYQLVKKPEGRNAPDWATKIHIATSPCYYHNYHLGELLASQLSFYINHKLLKLPEGKTSSWFGKKEVGNYLINAVFAPGAKYKWNDMIERATGEKLTAKYYAMQFVK